MSKLGITAVAMGLLFGGVAPAAAATDFDTWLEGVRREALSRGISQATIGAALTNLAPIPRVIELDRKQPEFTLTFQQYVDRVVPDKRVETGRLRFIEHSPILRQIGEAYGVQPRFIVALWGVETDYGRITGGFPVIASLATLAHDGRRSKFFRKELFNALRIIDGGHITFGAMTGSWAGAMGQSQFMPSSFLSFAVDHDGDGRRDIWSTQADIFASIANYLAKSKWRGDQTWGRPVTLPAGFDKSLASLKVKRPISAWQEMGVRRQDGSDLPTRDLKASIIFPNKKGGGPAFMVYDNFRAILRWNRSNYFATAVGLLSDRIGGL